MKLFTKVALVGAFTVLATGAMANSAKSLKHAQKATELRQSIFSLLGSNMGPLGGMAKGKIAFDAEKVGKHALRINQLSLMIANISFILQMHLRQIMMGIMMEIMTEMMEIMFE